MTRTLSSTIVAHVTGAVVYPVFLAQFQFDSANLNLWTGYRTLSFNPGTGAEDFLGAGDLGNVSPIMETSQTKATGLDFTLSGINSTLVSAALLESYQDRACALWLGFMDPAGSGTLLDSIEIFRGRMDVMTIVESGETSTIGVSAESVLVGLQRSNIRRFTAEDQKKDYLNDTGFDQVTQLQMKEIVWGKG